MNTSFRRRWTKRGSFYEDQKGFKIEANDMHLVRGVATGTQPHKWGDYLRIRRDGKWYYVHRLILNATPGEICDHINRDTQDNRRANLRIVSASVSALNQGKRSGASSQFYGVSKWHRYWRVTLSVNGKQKVCKYFKSEIEAAKFYNIIAPFFHGEHAKLNDIG